jgi:hypothetical protein
MDHVIEIRTYVLKEGMSKQFHQITIERSVPLLLAAGTDVLAYGPSLHSPDSYLLIRAYMSSAERTQRQNEFYGSDAWNEGPRDAIMACIDSYITVVIDADHSIVDSLRQLSCPA